MHRVLLSHGDGLGAVRNGMLAGESFRLEAHCHPALLEKALQLAGNLVQELAWRDYAGGELPRVNLPPGLVALDVYFQHHPEVGFATSALEQCQQLQKLILRSRISDDSQALFTALGQSRVKCFEVVSSFPIRSDLVAFLRRNQLEELTLSFQMGHDPSQLLEALRDCTKLRALKLCTLTLPAKSLLNLPRTLTKLCLRYARFEQDFDWSFLASGEVTDFTLESVYALFSTSMCSALIARLERGPLERLRMCGDLMQWRIPFHRIRKLEVVYVMREDLIWAIAKAIVLPHSILRDLNCRHSPIITVGLIDYLVPALRDPRCSLTELELGAGGKEIEIPFYQRRRLLALLHGQQLQRTPKHPLRRLPVELLRLVGMMLL